jgi:3-oxoisoapionate decarboxylase
MRIGLDTWSYHLAMGFYEYKPSHSISLEKVLDKIIDMGFENLHIDNPYLYCPDASRDIPKLAEKARRHNVTIELGPGTTSFEDIKTMIDLSALIGAKTMRIFFDCPPRWKSKGEFEKKLPAFVTLLKEAAAVAEKKRIRLALENHGDFSADDLLELLGTVNSPFLGICFDTGNPIIVMESPLEAAKKLYPYTFTTHIKDYLIEHGPFGGGASIKGVALGEGCIPLPEIISMLCCSPHTPVLNMEIPTYAHGTEEELLDLEEQNVRKSLLYLQKLLTTKVEPQKTVKQKT